MSEPDTLPRPGRRLIGLVGTTVFAVLVLGGIAGGVAALHLRAAAKEEPQARAPLPVKVMLVERQDSYRIEQRFAGRLEPARRTQLAFERAGLVTAVLRDEGDAVEAGAVVAQLDTEPLLAARDALTAQRAQAAADLDLARRTLRRQRELHGAGHVSAQRLDEARLSAAALEARVQALDAEIRALEIDIEKSALIAPFAGTVAARHLDEGAVVAAGASVLELLESGRPQARVGVSPEAARRLYAGAHYRIESAGQVLSGRLLNTRPDIAPDTRSVELLFELEGRGGLPFGEVVELHIARQVAEPGFWVPLKALYEDEKGLWSVFVAAEAEDGTRVVREAVEILHAADARAFVRGTLADRARVLLGSAQRVVPGQRVQIAATAEAGS